MLSKFVARLHQHILSEYAVSKRLVNAQEVASKLLKVSKYNAFIFHAVVSLGKRLHNGLCDVSVDVDARSFRACRFWNAKVVCEKRKKNNL